VLPMSPATIMTRKLWVKDSIALVTLQTLCYGLCGNGADERVEQGRRRQSENG